MRLRLCAVALAMTSLAMPAQSQAPAKALPDSAWDEALKTRKACEGEVALERERGLVLGTAKVLCEDLGKRWQKSIAAQFGTAIADQYAPLIITDMLATAGYQYKKFDYKRKATKAYIEKEKAFGCSLLRKALPQIENRLVGMPYSKKGHDFTRTTIHRITYEFQFCGANAKGLIKGMGSTKFHKAAGAAQVDCAKNTEAAAGARIAMCQQGIANIRELLREKSYPTVLQRNSAYLWSAHAFITMLEVKSNNGLKSEACKDLRGFGSFLTWLTLPANSTQQFLLRNITKRQAALKQDCA